MDKRKHKSLMTTNKRKKPHPKLLDIKMKIVKVISKVGVLLV